MGGEKGKEGRKVIINKIVLHVDTQIHIIRPFLKKHSDIDTTKNFFQD